MRYFIIKYRIILIFILLISEYSYSQTDIYHVQDGFDAIYKKYGHNNYHRKISYSEDDWPNYITRFVEVEYNNIPLLKERRLIADNAKVIGFTKIGELLQFVSAAEEWGAITMPGDTRPNNFGVWYQIKTLNGKFAWFFAKPGFFNQLGSIVERIQANTNNDNNTKSSDSFPIGTVIFVCIVIAGISLILIAFSGSSRETQSSNSTDSKVSSGSGSDYGSGYDTFSSSSYTSTTDDSYYNSTSDSDSYSDDNESETKSERKCPDCENIDINSFFNKGNGRCKICDGTWI